MSSVSSRLAAAQGPPSRSAPQPNATRRTKTVYVRDEPYDPSKPEEPQRPLPADHEKARDEQSRDSCPEPGSS